MYRCGRFTVVIGSKAAPPAAKESEIDDIMARFKKLRETGDSRREPSSAPAGGALLTTDPS